MPPELATPPPADLAAEAKPDPLFNPALEEHFKSYDQPKEAPKETPKPAAKAPEKPPDKAAEKPKEQPKAPEKAEKAPEPAKESPKEEKKTPEALEQFGSFKELRTKYEETKRRAEQHETKVKEYEAKLAEAAKTGSPADEKVWQEKIAAKEKELGEIRNKLAETEFTQSAEYQDKYWKPYVNTWTRATAALAGFVGQNPDGTPRTITKEDAELLLSLPDAKAYEIAKDLFGETSNALAVMTAHKIRVAEALEAVNEGKAQFQKLSEERRNKQFVESQQMEKTIGELWAKTNKEITESSQWFKPDEADPEGSELLAKGLEKSFKAFDREYVQSAKPEEVVRLHSELVQKAGAFDRLEHTVTKLQAELEAVKKERDELMNSAPTSDPTVPKVDDDSDKRPSELIDKINWGRR